MAYCSVEVDIGKSGVKLLGPRFDEILKRGLAFKREPLNDELRSTRFYVVAQGEDTSWRAWYETAEEHIPKGLQARLSSKATPES